MGTLLDLARNSGIKATTTAVQDQEKRGIFSRIASAVARPFLRTYSAAAGAIEGVGSLGGAAIATALGQKDTAQRLIDEASNATSRERDFGVLGTVRPVGVSEEGKFYGAFEGAKDIIGTGLEIGSYAAPAALPKIAGAAIPTAAKIAYGAATGNVAGGLSAIGQAMQEQKSILDTAKQGLAGAAVGTIVGGMVPAFSAVAKETFPWLANGIQKSTLRLTPTQKTNLGQKVDDVVSFLNKNNVIGTPGSRLEKVSEIYEATERTLQDALSASDATVSRDSIVTALKDIPSMYKNTRDFRAITRQVQDAVDGILEQFDENIPISALNEFKRSVYENAYNKTGDKVLDFVEHDIGDIVYTALADGAESAGLRINNLPLRDFNKAYSAIVNARKLLKIATGRKQAGLIAKLVASFAGSLLGSFSGPAGSAVGAAVGPGIIENIGGTLPRSAAASALQKAGNVSVPGIVQGTTSALFD